MNLQQMGTITEETLIKASQQENVIIQSYSYDNLGEKIEKSNYF